ncbi:MAG: TetR/AcrR family transcriptional regulator [Rhodoglobus sp.]
MTNAPSRGRPQASSREMLQEAAFELFLENGYESTTIGQITQRAGVSRNTFFNYFSSKSDVFWIDLDESLATVSAYLLRAPITDSAIGVVRDALLAGARELGSHRVPWALTQHELIGAATDLQSSAMTRLGEQFRAIDHFLSSRSGASALLCTSTAYAAIGAAVAAAQAWAAAGTTRGELEPYVHEALGPVCNGFAVTVESGASIST